MSAHDDGHGGHGHGGRGDEAEVRAKYERLLHLAESMRHVIVALKDLVPKAFEEGFRRRAPDQEEPWLVDWLQSDVRQRLETLLPRPGGAGPGGPGSGASGDK